MLRQALHELTIPTRGRGLHEVTGQVADWVLRGGFNNGLVTLHLRHTSASLLIQENADPDVRRDLEQFFARLVPHVRTALTAVNLSIPVSHGQLALGTWQGIYLWEHRRSPHSRTITAHFVGE